MTTALESNTGAPSPPRPKQGSRATVRRRTSLLAHGEPMVWLTGGALVLALLMIVGLLALVFVQGFSTFWPVGLEQVETTDGRAFLGEPADEETYTPEENVYAFMDAETAAAARALVASQEGTSLRRLLRTGNYEVTGSHFHWISDFEIASESRPEWAVVVERMTWGRFYGTPTAFRVDGETVATEPADVWARYEEEHPASRERFNERRKLAKHDIGKVSHGLEKVRIAMRQAELDHGEGSGEHVAATARYEDARVSSETEFTRIRAEMDALDAESDRFELVLTDAQGRESVLTPAEIVRAYPANKLGFADKVAVYFSRWGEFLWDDPREANTEGGVFPAIFGTVVMTLIMTFAVVPFGILGALYLREYAKQGIVVSAVRIAVNNLAGVPSIVFGVFGLGFFCYVIGARIDELFFSAKLPSPTYGTGGLMWASLTLALLTLPVVIVATEEALAAVPSSMREGSYACGATKWQTIQRIVLPRAAPGIMTGAILAIARGAGEVAPLMLVGAVKLAPEMPVDTTAPFVHPERSFMHLGFHIFDLGFQSPNSEAAKPMVYTTTFVLIAIVVLLNLAAISVRARLRKRYLGAAV